MATALHDKMKSVGSKRRKKIEARAVELISEEMALRELRKAHHRTQASMAKQLGISQDGGGYPGLRKEAIFCFQPCVIMSRRWVEIFVWSQSFLTNPR